MFSSINIVRFFLKRNKFFQIFVENNETFSCLNCFLFLVKAKLSGSQLQCFNTRMRHINVPVTGVMLGALEWPYIHNKWGRDKRLNAIASHYETLYGRCSNLMGLHLDHELKLFQFDHSYENISVKLDRPSWFIREGEIVINLFCNNLRVASIAFALNNETGKTIAYIGAVQGIHSGISSKQSLEIYKKLTKLFHGLRPRTLLLEVLKVYLKALGVSDLYGISDESRHHRHKYFGFNKKTNFRNNYNEFWEEHNGHYNKNTGFYQIDLKPAIRDIEIISSKKRSQYKKRNALIASLEASLISEA